MHAVAAVQALPEPGPHTGASDRVRVAKCFLATKAIPEGKGEVWEVLDVECVALPGEAEYARWEKVEGGRGAHDWAQQGRGSCT